MLQAEVLCAPQPERQPLSYILYVCNRIKDYANEAWSL